MSRQWEKRKEMLYEKKERGIEKMEARGWRKKVRKEKRERDNDEEGEECWKKMVKREVTCFCVRILK